MLVRTLDKNPPKDVKNTEILAEEDFGPPEKHGKTFFVRPMVEDRAADFLPMDKEASAHPERTQKTRRRITQNNIF